MKKTEALSRANSHVRYWWYRRNLNGTGPTFLQAVKQWWNRLVFELRNNL